MVIHRRNLPHLYFQDGTYFITYRLADTLPSSKVAEIKASLKAAALSDDPKSRKAFKKYDELLDKCIRGEKYLNNPNIASICQDTLHYPDGKDYFLICYCIMPNHVHLVFELLENNRGISKIMQSIKRVSAHRSNLLLNREGAFWQDESYDRLIRDKRELYYVIRYVLMNPVGAGLVENWTDWKYTYCHPNYIVI